jgi:branched-subunit amino acid aminotransferase/4-amino-4-deoxychorismate lyase
MPTIYCNGKYVAASRARIPADDHAVRWGIGLFEVLRAYNGRPFRLEDHVRRLRRSARHFKIKARLPRFEPIVRNLLKRNRLTGGYVRITLTEGGSLLVVVRSWKPPATRIYQRGATLVTAPWRRDTRSPVYGHKTLNYYENMLARWDARKRGAIDALLLGLKDEVLEGSASNVFVVRRGRLITPPIGPGILPGVTRKVVLEAARTMGIRAEERDLRLTDLSRSGEVFITNALIEIVPVARIDRRRIGSPGPVTQMLQDAYRRRVERECPTSSPSGRA